MGKVLFLFKLNKSKLTKRRESKGSSHHLLLKTLPWEEKLKFILLYLFNASKMQQLLKNNSNSQSSSSCVYMPKLCVCHYGICLVTSIRSHRALLQDPASSTTSNTVCINLLPYINTEVRSGFDLCRWNLYQFTLLGCSDALWTKSRLASTCLIAEP